MVVAVISILTTLAIPGIASAKRRANEASAITALRTISQAQSQYRVRFGTFGTVASLEAAGYLDQNFQDAQKSGYTFETASAPTTGSWALRANPTSPGTSGDRFFYIDTSGVIRYNDGSAATASDPAIE